MKFVVLDLEVTGYSLPWDRVLEVGACILDIDTGEFTKVYDECIRYDDMREYNDGYIFDDRPGCWIYQVGHMSVEDNLNAKKTWEEAIDDLRVLLKGNIVVFYGPNDWKVLKRWELDNVVAGYLDLDVISADYLREIIGKTDVLTEPLRKIKTDLEYRRSIGVVRTYHVLFRDNPLGIEKTPHRAYPDALIEAHILWALYLRHGNSLLSVAKEVGSLKMRIKGSKSRFR